MGWTADMADRVQPQPDLRIWAGPVDQL